jgi:hypothetical protein
MKYTKIVIKDNPEAEKTGKRCIAVLTKEDGKERIVKFGLNKSGGTFFDGATEEKKENYISRHGKMGEKWGSDGVCTAGFYSRWVLWSHRSLKAVKEEVKKHSGVSNVSVRIKKIKVTKPN